MDILTVKQGIIVHQVNAKGVMGAGLAYSIRNKWYDVHRTYEDAIAYGNIHLGDVLILDVGEDLYVCNLVGQDGYGVNKRYTDYDAVEEGLIKLKRIRDSCMPDISVYFPKNMGCGLGGGDWNIVQKLIKKYFPNAIICDLAN